MLLDVYDKEGNPITSVEEWGRLASLPDYKRVDLAKFYGTRVSTVWLGIDHSFFGGPPLIFETMVFPSGSWMEQDMDRYYTLFEAKLGHKAMVRRHLHRREHILAATAAILIVLLAWLALAIL